MIKDKEKYSQKQQRQVINNQGQQNIVKSIIYGSPINTSYGMLRSLCSAINHKDHIDKIIMYLRSNQNFQKYNKYVYAFRLQYSNNQTFITQQLKTQKQQFLQGYNDDIGLQGNGQRMLSLLQKFNVRNVLVIVAIRQKDPLREFNAQHYVQVVKCAKDLLSSLYDKVILSRSVQVRQQKQVLYQPLQVKEFQIPISTFYKPQKPKQNPNYVGTQFQRKFQPQDPIKKIKVELKYLNNKIKQLASHLQQIIQNFGQNEDIQVHFAVRYDKTKRVIKIFNMLGLLFGFQDKQQFLKYKMSQLLRSITSRSLTAGMIRQMNRQLMSDRQLKSQSMVKQNRICGILMEFLQVLLNSYSFARRLAMIQSQIQQAQQNEKKDQEETNNQQETSYSNKNLGLQI